LNIEAHSVLISARIHLKVLLSNPENSEPSMAQGVNESYGEFTNWTWSNTLNYVDTFADRHNLAVLAGTESTKGRNVGMGGSMRGYITTELDAWYIPGCTWRSRNKSC
jgi:TonB-dependent starch-binding outer membrane protein SusC